MKSFTYLRQLDTMDCGPTCLQMIAKYYGKQYSLPYLREKCYIDREGVSLRGIIEAAENIGFRTMPVHIPFFSSNGIPSLNKIQLPAIVYWEKNHFVVVNKITSNKVTIADPRSGKVELSHTDFERSYVQKEGKGITLILEPTPLLHDRQSGPETEKGFGFLFNYLRPHSRLVLQLILGLLLGTVFQLIFPFLTQSIVDVGIGTQNLSFIYLVLIGQLILFSAENFVRFIQNWIVLHISVRINVGLIADFLIKLMKLPISFFDSKHMGDLLQRIEDHHRIELFLTQSILMATLSILNIVAFGVVLLIYSIPIFLIFLSSGVLYVAWIFMFLKRRISIDDLAFKQNAENRDAVIEIIQGLPEIKLQGSEKKRRWRWAAIQSKLFKTQTSSLALNQYQEAGGFCIIQLRDILITVISAKAVLDGNISLGMMLAIQYIIGQLHIPLQNLIGFIRTTQDASLSLNRLSEIHNTTAEEDPDEQKMDHIPNGDLVLNNVSFKYSPISPIVLDKIQITIPRGKTTAIVGASGSGKTTLLKLLLGFYHPTGGRIFIGDIPLTSIYQKKWRASCGGVLQDGFIFSDTIANNISESEEIPNFEKVLASVNTANIADFIGTLPAGFNTMVGLKGNGLSQGQKQRLLIARAVYKNPEFLFFDEATNALDASNEKVIMEKLEEFSKGKTCVIVAHRLSTVKNADQIIVLQHGKVVERGTHEELVRKREHYFQLVQNQLELGN